MGGSPLPAAVAAARGNTLGWLGCQTSDVHALCKVWSQAPLGNYNDGTLAPC